MAFPGVSNGTGKGVYVAPVIVITASPTPVRHGGIE